MSDPDTASPQSATPRQGQTKDAAKALPFLGLALFMIPLAWSASGDDEGTGKLIYVFCVWLGLIVLSVIITRKLGKDVPKREETSS